MGEFKIQILCKARTLVPMMGVARLQLVPQERRISLRTIWKLLLFSRLVVLCQRRQWVPLGPWGKGPTRGPSLVMVPGRAEKNKKNGLPFLELDQLVNPLFLLSRIYLILQEVSSLLLSLIWFWTIILIVCRTPWQANLWDCVLTLKLLGPMSNENGPLRVMLKFRPYPKAFSPFLSLAKKINA